MTTINEYDSYRDESIAVRELLEIRRKDGVIKIHSNANLTGYNFTDKRKVTEKSVTWTFMIPVYGMLNAEGSRYNLAREENGQTTNYECNCFKIPFSNNLGCLLYSQGDLNPKEYIEIQVSLGDENLKIPLRIDEYIEGKRNVYSYKLKTIVINN